MREDALERHGVTERQFLEEAQKLCEACGTNVPKEKTRSPILCPLLWSGMGAVLTGFAWLLSVM